MGRFLIYFSYIGTHYRGMQIQRSGGEVRTDFKTVQGVLERCLQKLGPVNEVKIKTSSRTDSSVHALCNTVHVDLVHRCHPHEFDPHWLSSKLNFVLIRSDEKIRILNVLRVSDDFDSRRWAEKREYIYRLAVVKDMSVFEQRNLKGCPLSALEAESCVRVFQPFDVDLFLKAMEQLSGQHNFLSFTTTQVYRSGREYDIEKNLPIRIRRSGPLIQTERTSDILDFWDVHFTCQSFLYKQIRRMMGAAVAVAQGHMTLEKLQDLLDNPSVKNPGVIRALRGTGLHLTDVHYPRDVLEFEPKESPAYLRVPKNSEGLPEETTVASSTACVGSDILSSTSHTSCSHGEGGDETGIPHQSAPAPEIMKDCGTVSPSSDTICGHVDQRQHNTGRHTTACFDSFTEHEREARIEDDKGSNESVGARLDLSVARKWRTCAVC